MRFGKSFEGFLFCVTRMILSQIPGVTSGVYIVAHTLLVPRSLK